ADVSAYQDRPSRISVGGVHAPSDAWNNASPRSNRSKPRREPLMSITHTSLESQGATVVDGTRPYAFALADDGHLWDTGWDGTQWIWTDPGNPPTLPPRL